MLSADEKLLKSTKKYQNDTKNAYNFLGFIIAYPPKKVKHFPKIFPTSPKCYLPVTKKLWDWQIRQSHRLFLCNITVAKLC